MSGWRGWLLARDHRRCSRSRPSLVPAMPQPLSYHAFADCRTFWAIPNFFNVVSNLPFLVGGALGPRAHVDRGGGRFIDPREQLPYLVFFLGALLTCFGSAYYHAAPDNPRLVWDRLPMTLGFAGLVAAAVAERVDLKLGLRSLWPLLALGVVTVIYWYGTERAGAGNVIPYGVYQGWSIVVIVLVMFAYPARRYTPWPPAGLGRGLVRARQGVRDLRPAGLPAARRHTERAHHQTRAGGRSRCSPSSASCGCAPRCRIAGRMNATPRNRARDLVHRVAFADREEARRASARPRGQGHRGLPHDRRRRSRDGVPVGRQGFVHAARHPAVAASARRRSTSSSSRSTSTRSSRTSRPKCCPTTCASWACRST